MSSASRLKESTGTLTAPTRSWGSISSPSMTARSRIAAPCARISRSIASRSMAMRSDSARVSPAAAACDGNDAAGERQCERQVRPRNDWGYRNMHALRMVTARRRTSRWRSDDDGSAGYFRNRQKLTASDVHGAGAGTSAVIESAADCAVSAATKSTSVGGGTSKAAASPTRKSTCGSCGNEQSSLVDALVPAAAAGNTGSAHPAPSPCRPAWTPWTVPGRSCQGRHPRPESSAITHGAAAICSHVRQNAASTTRDRARCLRRNQWRPAGCIPDSVKRCLKRTLLWPARQAIVRTERAKPAASP